MAYIQINMARMFYKCIENDLENNFWDTQTGFCFCEKV